jgi:hypothetical protein
MTIRELQLITETGKFATAPSPHGPVTAKLSGIEPYRNVVVTVSMPGSVPYVRQEVMLYLVSNPELRSSTFWHADVARKGDPTVLAVQLAAEVEAVIREVMS